MQVLYLHIKILFKIQNNSEREISYLDVLVMLRNNRISTDVYSKQTDTYEHLDSRSCHPTHGKERYTLWSGITDETNL